MHLSLVGLHTIGERQHQPPSWMTINITAAVQSQSLKNMGVSC